MIIPIKSRFLNMSEKDFFEFSQELEGLKAERAADGTIYIMELTGSETGNLNSEVNTEVNLWNRTSRQGKTFDSSSGFTLPDKSVRSPDVSWIALKRWKALPAEDRKKFAHISPDFVIEIRSPSDSFTLLQEKMVAYRENGVRLAWLIDPEEEETWIYRANGTIDRITSFDVPLSGENVLPGFELILSRFWPLDA